MSDDKPTYRHCSRMRDYLAREKQEAERVIKPEPPPPQWFPPRKITWAEAELIIPGIEAEWRNMCGQKGSCVPPAGKEWRVEDHNGSISVMEIDYEGIWDYPPTWHRAKDGMWFHPFPRKKNWLPAVFFLDYKYQFKDKDEVEDLPLWPRIEGG